MVQTPPAAIVQAAVLAAVSDPGFSWQLPDLPSEDWRALYDDCGRSTCGKHQCPHNNDRLEFLGDALLKALISMAVTHFYPNAMSGDYTVLTQALTTNATFNALIQKRQPSQANAAHPRRFVSRIRAPGKHVYAPAEPHALHSFLPSTANAGVKQGGDFFETVIGAYYRSALREHHFGDALNTVWAWVEDTFRPLLDAAGDRCEQWSQTRWEHKRADSPPNHARAPKRPRGEAGAPVAAPPETPSPRRRKRHGSPHKSPNDGAQAQPSKAASPPLSEVEAYIGARKESHPARTVKPLPARPPSRSASPASFGDGSLRRTPFCFSSQGREVIDLTGDSPEVIDLTGDSSEPEDEELVDQARDPAEDDAEKMPDHIGVDDAEEMNGYAPYLVDDDVNEMEMDDRTPDLMEDETEDMDISRLSSELETPMDELAEEQVGVHAADEDDDEDMELSAPGDSSFIVDRPPKDFAGDAQDDADDADEVEDLLYLDMLFADPPAHPSPPPAPSPGIFSSMVSAAGSLLAPLAVRSAVKIAVQPVKSTARAPLHAFEESPSPAPEPRAHVKRPRFPRAPSLAVDDSPLRARVAHAPSNPGASDLYTPYTSVLGPREHRPSFDPGPSHRHATPRAPRALIHDTPSARSRSRSTQLLNRPGSSDLYTPYTSVLGPSKHRPSFDPGPPHRHATPRAPRALVLDSPPVRSRSRSDRLLSFEDHGRNVRRSRAPIDDRPRARR